LLPDRNGETEVPIEIAIAIQSLRSGHDAALAMVRKTRFGTWDAFPRYFVPPTNRERNFERGTMHNEDHMSVQQG
jgi:hypothetical protein